MIALDKKGDAYKGTKEKRKYKNVTKETKPKLKEISKEKGLRKEDILFIKNHKEEYILNSIAKQELAKKNIIKWPKNNKCYFYDDNKAYVTCIKKNGKYLYCSINLNTKEAFYLNTVDIFYVFSNKNTSDTETEMFKALGISTKEEEVKQNFRNDYKANIEMIESRDTWASEYPNFYNRVKSTLNTYKILNEIALEHVKLENVLNGEHIFYAGAEHISQFTCRKEPSIRNHLNMLALLGLIIKVEDKDIPNHMLQELNNKKQTGKKGNRVNCFLIPKLTTGLLREAEILATKMKDNDLSLNNIGYKAILDIFGEEMLNIVYGGRSKVLRVIRATDIKNNGESNISLEDIQNAEETEKIAKIEFEVKNIIMRDESTNYTMARVNILKAQEDTEVFTYNPIVTGYFPTINEKDSFKSAGVWKDEGEFGYIFEVSSTLMTKSVSEKGIIEFLSKNIKGIGNVTATSIVEKFEDKTFSVISDTPEMLSQIDGIGIRKAQSINKGFKEHKNFKELHIELLSLGFNPLEIINIYNIYGKDTLSKIQKDPYIVSRDKLVSFRKADMVAGRLELSINDQRRIKEGISKYIEYNLNNKGNLFVYKYDFINELSDYLNKFGAYNKNTLLEKEEIEKAINSLIKEEIVAIEKDKDDNICIYPKFYLDMENRIVEIIEEILKQNNTKIAPSLEIKDYLERKHIIASDTQKQAIIMALTNKISILSGGPGSGKTTTAKLVVDAIKEFNPNAKIELAAPTGKAATRLSEGMDRESKTIHRLIGLKGFGEKETQLKEVNADFLIIDEASMIDIYLFYSILSVIDYKTQVLIIGDHNQLPSIGPGLVLKDLIESKIIPCIILEEVYRQENGSEIVKNADKVIYGKKDLELEGSNDFIFIETKSIAEIQENIISNIENLIRLGYEINDIQVITPMNKGGIGALELNRIIQGKFNSKEIYESEIRVGATKVFRPKDKVMQITNNYNLGVFNGEVGEIQWTSETTEGVKVSVDFGNKQIIYTNENLYELVLAYAITVHKSQGSEFDAVIMPIHSTQSLLLNRSLVYTAWTRSREKLICIGDKDELYKSIDRTETLERNSQLKDKLIKTSENFITIPF